METTYVKPQYAFPDRVNFIGYGINNEEISFDFEHETGLLSSVVYPKTELIDFLNKKGRQLSDITFIIELENFIIIQNTKEMVNELACIFEKKEEEKYEFA